MMRSPASPVKQGGERVIKRSEDFGKIPTP